MDTYNDIINHVSNKCYALKKLGKPLTLCANTLSFEEEPEQAENYDNPDDNIIYNSDIFYKVWYPVETTHDILYRWSKGVCFLNLSGLKNKTLSATLTNLNPTTKRAETYVVVSNYITKKVLGAVAFKPNEPQDFSLTIDITTDDTVLMLACSNIWVPGIVDGTDDWRELGITISNVSIEDLDVAD